MMSDATMEDEARVPEQFANHPVSISEAKAEKHQDASRWTPRDALISALRRLDAGEIHPKMLLVVWDDDGDRGTYGYSVSCRDRRDAQGMMSRLWFKFMSGDL